MPNASKRFSTAFSNMSVAVTTAFGIEGAVDAAARINKRTRAFNYYHREDRAYAKARGKITLPADVTAWLNKEVL